MSSSSVEVLEPLGSAPHSLQLIALLFVVEGAAAAQFIVGVQELRPALEQLARRVHLHVLDRNVYVMHEMCS